MLQHLLILRSLISICLRAALVSCNAATGFHLGYLTTRNDPGRTRTCNLWFRRPTPYPLGHRALQQLHAVLPSPLRRAAAVTMWLTITLTTTSISMMVTMRYSPTQPMVAFEFHGAIKSPSSSGLGRRAVAAITHVRFLVGTSYFRQRTDQVNW